MPKARPKASLSQKRAGTRNSQPQKVLIRGVIDRSHQCNLSSTMSSYGNRKPPISTPAAMLAERRVRVDCIVDFHNCSIIAAPHMKKETEA